MKTYQDLIAVGPQEDARCDFILEAITEHKQSESYNQAKIAREYYEHRNPTIIKYQKIIYNMYGNAVPDIWAANHKIASNFFRFAVTQENQYLLGNGVTFQNEDTKEKLDPDFDYKIQEAGREALIGGVSFVFFNFDRLDVFKIEEFVPLYDEENGALRAGIRFWQIAAGKPLRATLYEEDGLTEYIKHNDKHKQEKLHIKTPKHNYINLVRHTEADGDEIIDGENYEGFPIVPFFANETKQSELTGNRGTIDALDLLNSNLVNNVDDGNLIYWVLQNADGMDDIDDRKFIERLKTTHVAHVSGIDGATAEAHTVEVPFTASQTAIQIIEDRLYKDFMRFNVKDLTGGAKTATEIRAAYQLLDSKVDAYEYQAIKFIRGILKLAGIEDRPTFTRSRIVNAPEEIQTILQTTDYLDSETITKKILDTIGLNDYTQDVLKKMKTQEGGRFNLVEGEGLEE